MGQWGCTYGVWTRQRYAQGERRVMREIGKRKPALVLHWSRFSTRRLGEKTSEWKAADKVGGGRVAEPLR